MVIRGVHPGGYELHHVRFTPVRRDVDYQQWLKRRFANVLVRAVRLWGESFVLDSMRHAIESANVPCE
jgi:hypothetical protein